MEEPQEDKWYFYNPITINTRTRLFGHRSALYRVFICIIACLAVWKLYPDFFMLFLCIAGCTYFNLDVIDLKKIKLNADYIHATRYLQLTTYDLRFWTRDVNAAIIWQGHGCHKLHVMLKDGTEQKIDLLGMVWFEREMLQYALNKLNFPDQEKYRR